VASPAAREETEDLLLPPTLVAELPEPDRTVIVLRFFYDLGQDAIAAKSTTSSRRPGGTAANHSSPRVARVRGLEPLTRRLGVDVATSAHPESA
jgi:hypothetical protein